MANLAASGVTIEDSWLEKHGGKQFKCRKVVVVLSAMGSAANKILGSLFDLAVVFECSPLVSSVNDLMVVAGPSYDGLQVLLKAAGTNVPADATGTFRFIVKGK